jgi:hypothetical protein
VQRRLMLLVSTITLVGLLTGVLIAWVAYHNEKAAVTAQLSGTARAISSAVDLYVRELETVLKVLASSPELAEETSQPSIAYARVSLRTRICGW